MTFKIREIHKSIYGWGSIRWEQFKPKANMLLGLNEKTEGGV
jgi:hypothetical protein